LNRLLSISSSKAQSRQARRTAIEPVDRSGPAVSRPGDLWRLGPHRVFCGYALKMSSHAALMGEEVTNVVFADPPYNVPVSGFVTSSARLAHREFAMGVGEMGEDEFIGFLKNTMTCARRFSVPGAVQYWCHDCRHQFELPSDARIVGLEHLNSCAWVKDNGGMGSLYRSTYDHPGVGLSPRARHGRRISQGVRRRKCA
jgi:hypothetical protein